MTQHTYGVLFAGLGGLSLGFKRAGFTQAFAIDFDQAACADHKIITGEDAICADLSTMTAAELREISPRRPDVLVSSPPCVAFSGCLPAAQAKTPEYQAISSLAFGGVWTALDAWRDAPPPLFVIENVPRIQTRGRAWLDDLAALFRDAGYAWAETTHDCGELGSLGQRRKRFLGVARHREQIRVYLYEPPKQRVRGCGEVLELLPCPAPGSIEGGVMHKVPRQSALNALRLALIPAGGDWRDLPERVQMVFKPRSGVMGVSGWDDTACTVVGSASVDTGAYAVADPRSTCPKGRREGSLGVTAWDDAAHAIIGRSFLQNTGLQVADPRVGYQRRNGALHVSSWAEPTHTIIGATTGGGKAPNVADPRVPQLVGETPFDVTDKTPRHWVIEAADGTWHRH